MLPLPRWRTSSESRWTKRFESKKDRRVVWRGTKEDPGGLVGVVVVDLALLPSSLARLSPNPLPRLIVHTHLRINSTCSVPYGRCANPASLGRVGRSRPASLTLPLLSFSLSLLPLALEVLGSSEPFQGTSNGRERGWGGGRGKILPEQSDVHANITCGSSK